MAYKVPRVVEVRASLPRSPSGKILRRLLEAP
jgi:acyl-CoA synthetase (AMP-forming)/AMP-acid ligase II